MIDDIAKGAIELGKGVISIIDQVVEDKDAKRESIKEVVRMTFDFQKAVLQMQTTPKVDAIVKLLYAFRDVVLPMLRPLGSALLSGFTAFAIYKNIPIPPVLDVVMGSAFPSWMVSRHLNKTSELKERELTRRMRGDLTHDEDDHADTPRRRPGPPGRR